MAIGATVAMVHSRACPHCVFAMPAWNDMAASLRAADVPIAVVLIESADADARPDDPLVRALGAAGLLGSVPAFAYAEEDGGGPVVLGAHDGPRDAESLLRFVLSSVKRAAAGSAGARGRDGDGERTTATRAGAGTGTGKGATRERGRRRERP